MFTRSVDDDGTAGDPRDQGACDGATELETTSNAEIDRAIEEIIREHGANAAIQAATRMMPTLDDGAVTVRSLWQRVLETAKEVQRENCGQPNGPAEAQS